MEEMTMRIRSLPTLLTAINLGLLVFLLAKTSAVEVHDSRSMLRGSGLQIVDGQGRVRASLGILPGGTTEKGEAYSETVLLRLIDTNGQPSVKIATSDTASGISLVGGDDESYLQLKADGPQSSLKIVEPGNREQVVTP
jgi:hypothetical protein